jgi:AcrR family transcriptional regulator
LVTSTTLVRRTQAERRATSRAGLLDATVSCLAERGYAGASLPEIVRRAGLSNGALWRHFRSKADLLAAASLEAERRLLAEAEAMSIDDLPPAERVDAAVDQLLAWVEEPAMQAIVELLLASRADTELRRALRATDERAGSLFVDVIRTMLGPELAGHPQLRVNVRQLGLLLYGIALTQHLRPTEASAVLTTELRALTRRSFDLPVHSG